MDSIESFSESKNLARVAAGFKGSEYFKAPRLYAEYPFIQGYPKESLEKYQAASIPMSTPTDPWVSRRK